MWQMNFLLAVFQLSCSKWQWLWNWICNKCKFCLIVVVVVVCVNGLCRSLKVEWATRTARRAKTPLLAPKLTDRSRSGEASGQSERFYLVAPGEGNGKFQPKNVRWRTANLEPPPAAGVAKLRVADAASPSWAFCYIALAWSQCPAAA